MPRPIKFRCFDNGVWHYATLDEISQEIGAEYGIPENVSAFLTGKNKTQFSGLLDKNGKEIYEGDLIAHSTQLNKPCKIVYHEGCFVGTPGDYPFFTEWSKEFLETEMEVIGNIYQDANLLNNGQ